ncbi:VacJ family lipoprotein [Croceicoccus sp. Ery5]|uniref:MlaA family lipoprotein n=1 Tax=Croceicoccus sp. Ery5 TaxID=1703340 RepID=UPI001E51CC58|nr:VacJ family lipoprotein [Croceicoccus sp. Ery5]
MVISGLAAALVMGGAGVADNAPVSGKAGFAQNLNGGSPAAMAVATPLPSDVLRVLERKSFAFRQDAEQPLPSPEEAASAGQPAATEPETPPSDGGDVADGGEIIVSGEVGAPKGDPAERINALSYEVVDKVDMAVVEPIADAYSSGIPEPVRDGVDNFLSNLGEPVSALHYLLQLKPGKALKTLGRFAINTTLGIGGVFDVAAKEPFGMEYEPNGLANTLGYYGVGPGPYLYLPLIGSTTVRDLIGRTVDLAFLPTVVGKPFNSPYYVIPAGTLNSLNDRVDKDAQIASVRDKCGDPYAAERDLYLVQRAAEIEALKGNHNPDLGEIGERLEFNCDIEISDTPTGVTEQTDFVRQSTTLIDGSAGSEAAAEGLFEAEPEAETETPDAVSVEQPAPPEAPEPAEPVLESRPVVQPLPTGE